MRITDKYRYVPIIKNNDNTPSINIEFKTMLRIKANIIKGIY